MITKRIVANLVAFAVVSAALIAYGVFDLLGNPFRSQTAVSTVLPSASGLAPNFLVTLNGVDVGEVKSVTLAPRGARVTMTLDPGSRVPDDVAARIVIANALGEQEVELVPRSTTAAAPPLRSGEVIPAAADPIPADVGTVVAEATRLLDDIPAGDLNTVLHELAVALNGNAGNLRAIASSSELFSQEFLASQQQFESLLANAPPVLDTIAADGPQLQQSLADTAVLVQVLANHADDLVRLFGQGTDAAQALGTLVAENRPDLACLLHDSADLAANLAQPANLTDLDTALKTNQLFFGAVAAISPEGPAKALTAGDQNRDDQEWLRTRLLIPPGEPSADAYSTPVSLPAVLPGAACDTEFGAGAPAVTQAGFTPTGPNGHVEAPSGAEAQVRGAGPDDPAVAPTAARLASRPEDPSLWGVLLMAGLVLVGWTFTLGHRRGRRSAGAVRAGTAGGPVRSLPEGKTVPVWEAVPEAKVPKGKVPEGKDERVGTDDDQGRAP